MYTSIIIFIFHRYENIILFFSNNYNIIDIMNNIKIETRIQYVREESFRR